MAAPGSANYNVRELLELERKIYQESIDRSQRQLDALMAGTLDSFVAQCRPFAKDRARELEAAAVHLQLNESNGLDLLEFELKQADDVYADHRQALKRQLLTAAREKRDHILATIATVESDNPSASSPVRGTDLKPASLCESPTEGSAAAELGAAIDVSILVKELGDSLATNQTAFNLRHLEHNIPPATAIVADVVEEMRMLTRRRTEQTAYACEKGDVEEVAIVDGHLKVGPDTIFRVRDHVILWSGVSEEEFFGQIEEVDDVEGRLKLLLLCGTPVHVSVDYLARGLCTLKLQGGPRHSLGFDERSFAHTPRDRRKRHKRKHTIGLRQKL